VFNGGPGSSSVWLHLGLVGPKRVLTDAFGNAAPPYRLVDNEHTLLTHSDLVFIDPIGTGYSRMLDGEPVKEFHDYQRDLESVGEFIRDYLSRENRWASPKYLAGESYGTTRAAGLSHHLQDKYSLWLDGVMLISCALDFSALRFDAGHDLPYVLFLPTYAATAWQHKKLGAALQKKSLKEVVALAEAFAESEYAPALFKGDGLSKSAAQAVAGKIAAFTGLSERYVLQTNLRVNIHRFTKELLRTEGKTVGRLDSRFTGHDRDDAGELPEFDPSFSNLEGAYGTLINHYLRADLQFTHAEPYTVRSPLYLTWGWKSFSGRYPNAAESLRRAMHMNPHMRVYVASGYCDLATPHFASDYVLNHAGIRAELHGNISKSYFDAGHMMYVNAPDLVRLGRDMQQFVQSAAQARPKKRG
jgi:carboxypeptidase C (cathepsin A)